MSTALAIFVKTPDYSEFKTRLQKGLSKQKTLEFYKLCLNCHLENAYILRKISKNNIKIYWAVAEKQAVNHPMWQSLPTIHSGYGDLGHRLHNAYSRLRQKHNRVILIGADSPQLGVATIFKSQSNDSNNSVIGRTCDGGFYLFSSAKIIPKKYWTNVQYSQNDTCNHLVKNIQKISRISYIKTLTDVDEAKDLHCLYQQIKNSEFPAKVRLKQWIELEIMQESFILPHLQTNQS